jgi:hypothetical protein
MGFTGAAAFVSSIIVGFAGTEIPSKAGTFGPVARKSAR